MSFRIEPIRGVLLAARRGRRTTKQAAAHAVGRSSVVVTRDASNVRLGLTDESGPKKPYMIVSHAHYDKLKALHAQASARNL